MRTSRLAGSVALVLASLAIARGAHALQHRYTYINGGICQSADPANKPVHYSDLGLEVTPSNDISVACSVPMAEDASSSFPPDELQQLSAFVYWEVPPADPMRSTPAVDPTCTIDILTTAGGEIYVSSSGSFGPSTKPVYVFSYTGTLPPGTIQSISLYCLHVANGITLKSIALDTCYAGSIFDCF